jgi:hypothetical protein
MQIHEKTGRLVAALMGGVAAACIVMCPASATAAQTAGDGKATIVAAPGAAKASPYAKANLRRKHASATPQAHTMAPLARRVAGSKSR